MIDKELYCETFSKLQASPEAKKEVLCNMKPKKIAWKTVAVAAVMTIALAATAAAANLATDGQLLQILQQVWSDGFETRYEVTDESGNLITISAMESASVTVKDGKMLLHAAGETVDVTEEMEQTGSYHFETSTQARKIVVDVTGSLEDWALTETVTDADGVSYTTTCTSSDTDQEISEGTVIISEHTDENGVENVTSITTTVVE